MKAKDALRLVAEIVKATGRNEAWVLVMAGMHPSTAGKWREKPTTVLIAKKERALREFHGRKVK